MKVLYKILLVIIPGLVILMSSFHLSAQEIILPENYGGKREFNELIKIEMIYPQAAIDQKIEGKTSIHFHIDKTGSISEIKITDSPHPLLSKESLRLFDKLLWQPGLYRGAAADMEQNIEFTYKIKKYNKIVRNRSYETPPYKFTPYDTSNIIYDFKHLTIEPEPWYDGRKVNLSRFISKNMKYPEAALKQSITGKVRIFFVIEPHGMITNARILEHLGAGCCEEALRMMRLIEWIPGKSGDKYVRTSMTVDVSFSLQ